MNLSDLILQMLPIFSAGVGVYAAIRGDIAKLHERSTIALATANKAHARIDEILKEKKS